jgi:hypothetical protein
MTDPILNNPLVVWVPKYPSIGAGVGARFGGPFADGKVNNTFKFDVLSLDVITSSGVSSGVFNIGESSPLSGPLTPNHSVTIPGITVTVHSINNAPPRLDHAAWLASLAS